MDYCCLFFLGLDVDEFFFSSVQMSAMDDEDQQLVADLMASMDEIDEVYFQENFDSLLHVMDLLAKDEAEVAKDAIKAQLDAASDVLDYLVDENHERVLASAVRHGESLDFYRDMSAGLRQLVVQVDEARRSMHPIASDSLLQLRFKRAVLTEVTEILQSVAQLQGLPQEIQALLVQGSIVDASQTVIKAVELALREDLVTLMPLEPTRKQLFNLKETCYAALVVEIKRLIYGCEVELQSKKSNTLPAADENESQRSLLNALDVLQQFGSNYILRARADLASSLRPELRRCCEFLEISIDSEALGVGGQVRGNSMAGRVVHRLLRLLQHLHIVLRMHLFVSLTLRQGQQQQTRDEQDTAKHKPLTKPPPDKTDKLKDYQELAKTYGMALVWEAVQLQAISTCCETAHYYTAHSLPPYLPTCLPPSPLPTSLSPSLPPSLTPSLPLSMFPYCTYK